MSGSLLSIRGLRTAFVQAGQTNVVLDGIDLSVGRGETIGLLGESGCGKSICALSIMRLLPPNAQIIGGHIEFDGVDLLGLPAAAMRAMRGRRIAMIFQDPMTCLNPFYTVGSQIVEAMRAHGPGTSRQALRARAVEALETVRIPSAARRFDDYPHQMSGGMRQRVMIAMALACEPELLIADEPTTALDVTVQKEILTLLSDLQRESGMAMIFVSHDLGVVAQVVDRVAVMYCGEIVEHGTTADLFDDPQHPYTIGLLGSVPRLEQDLPRLYAISGTVPPPNALPPGCRFQPRCAFAGQDCTRQRPALHTVSDGHAVACLHAPVETFAA